MYEVDQLVYAAERLLEEPEGMESTFCSSPSPFMRVASSVSFGGKEMPTTRTTPLPITSPTSGMSGAEWSLLSLAEIMEEKRFGREVMHLTYDRIDGIES
jgi:hypothetical protein